MKKRKGDLQTHYLVMIVIGTVAAALFLLTNHQIINEQILKALRAKP